MASMAELNDNLLVEKTLKGNSGSFRVLVERYQHVLFNLACRISQNRDMAQDMAQEAFVRAYENLHRFDPKKSFFTWLYTICINLTLNEVKKRGHYQQERNRQEKSWNHKAIPGHNLSIGELAEVEDRIEKKRKRALIDQLLQRISDEYRTAVILRYQEELSYQEIAEILGISVSLAKVRVHRGLEKLRTFLLETENNT